MLLCLSRSALAILIGRFPRVLREWIESTCNYYLATLRATAMRRTRRNCNYTRLHCYKYSGRTQGIRNNGRFLSVIDS